MRIPSRWSSAIAILRRRQQLADQERRLLRAQLPADRLAGLLEDRFSPPDDTRGEPFEPGARLDAAPEPIEHAAPAHAAPLACTFSTASCSP